MSRYRLPHEILEREVRANAKQFRTVIGKENSDKRVSTGTTILGIRFNGGVLIAADRQTTDGYQIFEHDSRKLHEISHYSVVAAAGTVPIIQFVIETLKHQLNIFRSHMGFELPFYGQAHLFQKILRYLCFEGLYDQSVYIFAGFDGPNEKPLLYSFDDWGGKYLHERHVAMGSGGRTATPLLDELAFTNQLQTISADLARVTAMKAIYASGHRDVYTSSAGTLPLIMFVNEAGVHEFLPQPISTEGGKP